MNNRPITVRLDNGNTAMPVPEYRKVERGKNSASSTHYTHRRNESNYSNLSITSSTTGQVIVGKCKMSDGLYSSIRTSNPWSDDDVFSTDPVHNGNVSQNSESPGKVKIETRPSIDVSFNFHQGSRSNLGNLSHTEPILHRPSYEGTGYGPFPLPGPKETNSSQHVQQTRIPSPIKIPPYSHDNGREYRPIVERSISLAETLPVGSEPAPVIRRKNLQERNSHRGHVQGFGPVQLAQEENTLGLRIVSKENIRAALADMSRETSTESLLDDKVGDSKSRKPSTGSVGDKHAFARIGGRGLNTGEYPNLQTFNTHMFPRKETQTLEK